jgi:hypothetical protein
VSILLLIGAVMALGSIGYILYSTFAPKKPESHVSPGIIFNRPYVKSPESSRPQDSAMINKRKELREHERNQLFEKLGGDAETEEKSDDDLHVHERHLSGDKKIEMPAQRKTAVPITKPVPKENIFDKLRNILPKESQDISKVKDAKKDYAKDSKVFEKLSDISKAKESLATDISKISGAPKARISDALENIRNDKDAIKLFGELDRSKIMSNIFQDILSNLISSRTIGKSDVSRILFEYMDRNVLSKADVAKISKDLKLI